MSDSLPLRNPAWNNSQLPIEAEFGCAVQESTLEWISTCLAPIFFEYDIKILGGLRAGEPQNHLGHFLVDSDAGKFVLHIKPVPAGDDAEEAAQLSDHLFHSGLDISRFRRALDGRAEVVFDGWAVTATSYAEARHWKGGISDAKALGIALGNIHRCLADYPPTEALLERNRGIRKRLAQTAKNIQEGEPLDICEEFIEPLKISAMKLDPEFTFASVSQRVHGDISIGNVLFKPNGMCWICDFENSGFAWWPREFDVGSAILRFCYDNVGRERPEGHVAEEWSRELAKSYEAARGQSLDWGAVISSIKNLTYYNLVGRYQNEKSGVPKSLGEWEKFHRLFILAESIQ